MQHIFLKLFGFILLSLLGHSAWALSCYEGSGIAAFGGTRSHTETISDEILVPNGITRPDTVLWRSQTYSTQFTCFDTDGQSGGEHGFLYWDPEKSLSNIHGSIALGITINGIDYPLRGGALDIGQATSYDFLRRIQNCRQINAPIRLTGCARPETITLRYSIFIKSTGSAPPRQGNIPNVGSYSLFQVDGRGGLNSSTKDANFRLNIRGLNNIRFVECNPQVSIEGTSGNSVDFGRIYTLEQNVNRIIARKTFTIKADLTQPDSGGVCDGKMLMASFNAPNLQNNTTILPDGRNDIGIQIFKHGENQALQFKTPVELAILNNGVAQNEFDAGLLQIASRPQVGTFNATATVEVTFK